MDNTVGSLPEGAGRTRWAAASLLIRAFPGRVLLLAGLVVLTGALPALFALLVARLVQALPGAVRAGLHSPDGRRIVGTLIALAVVLLLQELITAARQVAKWDLYRCYEEYLMARVMRATLAAPRLEFFEDPPLAAVADRAVRIGGLEPGDLVDGLVTKWTVQAPGLAAAVLVATVWPVAAIILVALWVVIGRQRQMYLGRTDPWRQDSWGEVLRRRGYLLRVGVMPAWAKEVRVFGLVDWLAGRFGRESALFVDELSKARRLDRRSMAALNAAVTGVNLVVLVLAARSALAGHLGLGALTILAQGLFGMGSLADQAGDNLVAYGASRVPDVRALEQAVATQVRLPAGTRSAKGLPVREIRFEGVRFAYPGRDAAVFDGLNLRIEAGRSLAVVGLNGAGKTTLIKLLCGLQVPQGGRISVDGEDLAALSLNSWRRAMAAIFQDFVRYELPARDNIGFGAVEALRAPDAEERWATAARRVGAAALLAGLPQGQGTPLSARFTGGVDISGGQWQRIALARAMAAVEAGARVLVLDEPTAHLDVRAEADLYERFLTLTQGLTTILISHRFSTVRRADRIIVLEAGRIIEDGSHEDLVRAGGRYARLFRKQAMRYVDLAQPSGGVEDGDEA